MLFIFVGIIIGKYALNSFVSIIPHSWDLAARYTEMAIIGVGIGTVLPLYRTRKIQYVLLAGLGFGILIFYLF
jgi:hypothetical protein